MDKIKSITGEGFFFEETANFSHIKLLLDNKSGKAGIQEKIKGMNIY